MAKLRARVAAEVEVEVRRLGAGTPRENYLCQYAEQPGEAMIWRNRKS